MIACYPSEVGLTHIFLRYNGLTTPLHLNITSWKKKKFVFLRKRNSYVVYFRPCYTQLLIWEVVEKSEPINSIHSNLQESRLKSGFPWWSVVKNLAADAGDLGLISGSGRYPGAWNGNPLQYSCRETPKDRGASWAMVHGVAKSDRIERVTLWLSIQTYSNSVLYSRLS